MRAALQIAALLLFASTCAANGASPVALTPIAPHRVPGQGAGQPLPPNPHKANIWPAVMIAANLRVVAIDFSPDGKLLAFAGGDPKIRIIQTGTWHEQKSCAGHKRPIWDLHMSDDGKRLISGSDDGTARVWDVQTGDQLALLPVRMPVTAARFLPGGKLALLGDFSGEVSLWDVATEKKIRTVAKAHEGIRGMGISRDAKRVAVGSASGMHVWDIESGREIAALGVSGMEITDAALSPDGKTLAAAGWDQGAELWNVESQTSLHRFADDNLTHTIGSATFGFGGKVCFLAGTESILACESANGAVRAQLTSWVTQFFRVAASPDGRWVAAGRGGSWPGQDDNEIPADKIPFGSRPGSSVDVWDLESPPRGVHGDAVHAIAVSRDRRLIASAGEDGALKIWTAPGLREQRTFHSPGSLTSVAFSPANRRVAAGGSAGIATAWPVNGGDGISVDINSPITGVAFLTDDLLAIAGGKIVTLVDLAAPTPATKQLRGHEGTILCISPSPDGRRLVTAADDATVRIWDVATQKELRQLPRPEPEPVTSLAYSPDGKRILLIDQHYGPYALDAESAAPLAQFNVQWVKECKAAAWSPNGSLGGAWTDSRGGIAIFQNGASHSSQSVGNGMWRIEAAAFLDNSHLVCGTTGGQVTLFELASMSDDFPNEVTGDGVFISTVSADGAYGVTTGPQNVQPAVPNRILWDLQKKTALFRFDAADAVALSPDHQKLAYGVAGISEDFIVRDIAAGTERRIKPIKGTPLSGAVNMLAFSKSNRFLAVAATPYQSGRKLRLYDLTSNTLLWEINADRFEISMLMFSPDEKMLVTSSVGGISDLTSEGQGGRDFSTWMLRVSDGGPIHKIPPGAGRVAQFFTPDGKKFILVNKEGLVVIYDGVTFDETGRINTHRAVAAAVSQNGKFVLTVPPTGDAKLVDLDTLRQVAAIPEKPGNGIYPFAVFLPDGTPAVWVNGQTLRIVKGEVPR